MNVREEESLLTSVLALASLRPVVHVNGPRRNAEGLKANIDCR